MKISRWVTLHGFALNVTDEPLPWFDHIVPCGLADRTVTSLQREGLDILFQPAFRHEIRTRPLIAFYLLKFRAGSRTGFVYSGNAELSVAAS